MWSREAIKAALDAWLEPETATLGNEAAIRKILNAASAVDGDAQAWNSNIEMLPEDGREILVLYGHQGGVVEVANFSNHHNCWMSKGKLKPCLKYNVTHWTHIPAKESAIRSLKR